MISDAAGFKRSQIAFLTAYQDRESAGFRRTVSQLAWNSFAWFASEPDSIKVMHSGIKRGQRLSDLLATKPTEC